MPNEQRGWGVLFTNAGLSELRDVLEPYLSTGSIGPYLYCKQVDMGNPYLRMIVDFHHRTLFFLLNGDMELHRDWQIFV